MATDMQSLTLIFSLVTGFVALMLFIYWRTQKTYDGFSHWTWGSILLPLGFLLVTVSAFFPSAVLAVVANILFIVSVILRLDGTSRFISSEPLPPSWYGLLLPISFLFLYFTYIQDSFTARSLVSAAVIAPVLIVIVVIALRSEERENRIINYCFAATILLCGFLEILRTIQWTLHGLPSYTNVDMFTILVFISALLLDVLATGFFLMLNLVRSQRDLATSEERYRTLSDNLPDYVFVHDGSKILYANPASTRLTGMSCTEILNCPLADIIAPESRTEAGMASREVLDRRVPVTGRDIVIQPSRGEKRLCTIRRVPISFQGKNAVLSVLTDITEQKQAGEALRKSREQLALAIEGSGVGLWDWDIVSGEIQINERWAEIVGYTLAELSPLTISSLERLCNTEDLKTVCELLKVHFLRTSQIFEAEVRVRHRDGRWVWVLNRGKVVAWDDAGRPVRMSGTQLDITDRKKAEEALRTANKKLNLLSGITRHDIRNQLTILAGCLELSEQILGSPDELTKLLKKEQRIAEIIDRQIGFTRDYEDLGVKSPVWQDAGLLAGKAASDLSLGKTALAIGCRDIEVFADPLLEKVFYNLLDNSLRYGGDGLTRIRIFGETAGEDLRIIFEDDGAGIRYDDKERLFTRGFGKNTGLGLFLSREILSITGIAITETGEPGRGARFEILVPKGEYRYGRTGNAR